MIPPCAIQITTMDNNHLAPPDFNPLTENSFTDNLGNQLSHHLSVLMEPSSSEEASHSDQDTPTMDITAPTISVSHGGRFFANQRCSAICNLKTIRRCPDCPRKPPLCQTPQRDCHSKWHGKQGLKLRRKWFSHSRPSQVIKTRVGDLREVRRKERLHFTPTSNFELKKLVGLLPPALELFGRLS